jgi:hypothetical protein
MGKIVHIDAPPRMSLILCFVALFLSPHSYRCFIPGNLLKFHAVLLSSPAGQCYHTSPCKADLPVGCTTSVVSLLSKYDSVHMLYVNIKYEQRFAQYTVGYTNSCMY